MPDNIEEKTSETKPEETKTESEGKNKEEVKETEGNEEKSKEPSKPEEGEEEKEVEEKEPPKRFPKQEQNPVEKQLGFLARKLEKLEKENEALRTGVTLEEGLEPEEEKPVTRKELNELLDQKEKEITTDRMLSDFLSENPDYRKYEKRIRKYVSDPDYSNIPIGFIASGIVGEHIDEEANIRVKMKTEADKEAEKTKLGGSSKRSIPGAGKKIWELSREEFEAKQAEVMQRGRE